MPRVVQDITFNYNDSNQFEWVCTGKPATQLVPLLEALMERGADRNAADSQGMTALHQAAKSSPCAVLDALLGPDAAAINSQDKVIFG